MKMKEKKANQNKTKSNLLFTSLGTTTDFSSVWKKYIHTGGKIKNCRTFYLN